MQTATDSQPKKSSSPKRRLSKSAETILRLTSNAWWPFDRVDGKLLEKLHRENITQTQGEALL